MLARVSEDFRMLVPPGIIILRSAEIKRNKHTPAHVNEVVIEWQGILR